MILETYKSHLKLSQVLMDQAIRCYKQLGFSARNVGPRFAQRLRSRRWMGPDFRDPWRKRICIPLILNDLHVLFFIWPSVSFSKSNESHILMLEFDGLGSSSVLGKDQERHDFSRKNMDDHGKIRPWQQALTNIEGIIAKSQVGFGPKRRGTS